MGSPTPCCRWATGPTRSSRPTPTTSAPGSRCTTRWSPSRSTPPGRCASPRSTAASSDTFVVVNGDVLTDLDLPSLWEFHHRCGAEGTIALTPVDDPSRYGVVPIDDGGRVEAFVEKPPPGEAPTNWINAGTYVLEPSVLDRIPAGRRVSIERETFPGMVDGRLPLRPALRRLLGRRRHPGHLPAGAARPDLGRPRGPGAGGPPRRPRRGRGPGRAIGPDARRAGRGRRRGARVGAAAREPGRPGAPWSSARSSARRSVIGEGARLTDLSVVGDGVEVAPGAVLHDARLPEEEP